MWYHDNSADDDGRGLEVINLLLISHHKYRRSDGCFFEIERS